MKFFADTANVDEIEYCFLNDVNDGITTNPKIIESTGDLSNGFDSACRNLLYKYPQVPVSLETDLRGIDFKNLENVDPIAIKESLLNQAYSLSSWAENVVVKIPICYGGLLAVEELTKKGIKTNVTACMTPYQALRAADSGATYVSLFANRMLDSEILKDSGNSLEIILNNSNWKTVLKSNKDKYFDSAWEHVLSDISYVASKLENTSSELIVGSIRAPEDIQKIVRAEPQIITIPTKIVGGLNDVLSLKESKRSIFPRIHNSDNSLNHPMTQYTIEEFEESASKYRK